MPNGEIWLEILLKMNIECSDKKLASAEFKLTVLFQNQLSTHDFEYQFISRYFDVPRAFGVLTTVFGSKSEMRTN